jgi:hypothetical protein
MKSPITANHEMNRELLWRNYPTDMRGTSLRNFWSIRGVKPRINSNGSIIDPATDETFMDIKKIHQWRVGTTHNALEANTARPVPPENMLVLAIRGELLKKYPNAMVYARKAIWQTKVENSVIKPDSTKPRLADPLALAWTGSAENPYLKTPIFSARVDDMMFIGFSLSATDAKGKVYNGSNWVEALANPGWYFVIEERAGEPVFGADKCTGTKTRELKNWDELEWGDILTQNEYKFIDVMKSITVDQLQSNVGPNVYDMAAFWGANAGDMALALLQRPSRVFLHGYDMLVNL